LSNFIIYDFVYVLLWLFIMILIELVDVVGLMTGISAEREYVRDGKVTKMIVLKLTDDR
jgi:hypothetical protein